MKPDGNTASVTLEPATTALTIDASVKVVGGTGGRISASRRDNVITVRGSVGGRSGPPREHSLVVDNPAMFTTGALRAALQAEGVKIDGQTRLAPTPPSASEVAALSSPPLAQIIGGDGPREHQHRRRAAVPRRVRALDVPDRIGGNWLGELENFLIKEGWNGADRRGRSPMGSGLSQLDRVTPRSMVQLLGYVHGAGLGPDLPQRGVLPVEGESGTPEAGTAAELCRAAISTRRPAPRTRSPRSAAS